MVFKLLSIELLKTKRSLALLMMLLCPLMVVIINALLFINDEGRMVTEKGWVIFWSANFAMWGYFMMPLYVALITALLNGIEHQSHGWRYMMSLPVKKQHVFLSKFLLAMLFMMGATVLLCLMVLLFIVLMSLMGYQGHEWISFRTIKQFSYACVASLGILTIQHLISWRYANIVISLGTGVIATMSIVQFSSSRYWHYHPWSYTLVATNSSMQSSQNLALMYSLLLSIFIISVSMFIVSRREIRC